ncbi:hypothetical protein [Agromyces sp. NBRC 114283]|uniref:hypothetical protein n=1 Tax=Agromyces sp. NBRC 114283 TaxID=2994521 RepID=UPI0024A3AEFA|nr:hypothetical protein [Agromyces sp. NBRC 114283]GLU91312.1 hypothetical protein Agsp01_35670 [Agromyces sp. NBRC 114283]
MSELADLGRTLADSADRESWLAVHGRVIGSSTAGKFAKPGSVETYVRQILEPRTFRGNAATESGNRWEPMLLAWAGADPNSLLIHHPDNERFGATVDGTRRVGARLGITETKTKHNRIVTGPTPYEIRQLAWQLYCIPEAEFADWVWGELVEQGGEWVLRRDPQALVFYRDHPQIVAATSLIVPIAHDVVAALDAVPALEGAF